MRACRLLPITGLTLLLLSAGCAHFAQCPSACEPCGDAHCPPPCPASHDCPSHVEPCPPEAPPSRPCPAPVPPPSCPAQPNVEVRPAPTVHVKVPQQQVIVENAPAAAPVAPQMVAPAAPAFPQQMMMTQAQPQAAPLSSPFGESVEEVPQGLARPGLTFDFIRIPIPFPRLIAIPTTRQIRVPMNLPTYAAQPVAAAPFAPVYQQPVAPMAPVYQQPVAPVAPVYQQPVAPVYQPVAPPPVAAPVAPPTQMTVPVQGQVTVPVQGQVTVPVNGQVTVPVSGQAPVAPAAPVVNLSPPAAPTAPVVLPAPAAQSFNPQDVDNFCHQVEALKAALEAQKAAHGCPK